MKIARMQTTLGETSKKILGLLRGGADIVIVEHPKGFNIKDGHLCHVFFKDTQSHFVNKLWKATNWFKIHPIDKSIKVCLRSPYEYARTVQHIKKCFPKIMFEEIV